MYNSGNGSSSGNGAGSSNNPRGYLYCNGIDRADGQNDGIDRGSDQNIVGGVNVRHNANEHANVPHNVTVEHIHYNVHDYGLGYSNVHDYNAPIPPFPRGYIPCRYCSFVPRLGGVVFLPTCCHCEAEYFYNHFIDYNDRLYARSSEAPVPNNQQFPAENHNNQQMGNHNNRSMGNYYQMGSGIPNNQQLPAAAMPNNQQAGPSSQPPEEQHFASPGIPIIDRPENNPSSNSILGNLLAGPRYRERLEYENRMHRRLRRMIRIRRERRRVVVGRYVPVPEHAMFYRAMQLSAVIDRLAEARVDLPNPREDAVDGGQQGADANAGGLEVEGDNSSDDSDVCII